MIRFGGHPAEYSPGRRLTNVRVDAEGMGTNTARLLLRELRGRRGLPERRVLPVEVMPLDSVAPLAPAAAPARVAPKR